MTFILALKELPTVTAQASDLLLLLCLKSSDQALSSLSLYFPPAPLLYILKEKLLTGTSYLEHSPIGLNSVDLIIYTEDGD